jgi:hypothetical protein
VVHKLNPEDEARFFAGVEASGRFLMGQSNVHLALAELAQALDADGIPYAIVGAMALNEHGYRRTTEDVDVLLTADGLARFKAAHVGRGWVEKFPGSRGLRDARHGVNIDVVIAGEFPGDGKPKPVRFPDPATVAERGAHVALLPLDKLIELKLASGMSAPHRLRDLADVIELVRIRALPENLAESLDESVRDKYRELWRAAQAADVDQ